MMENTEIKPFEYSEQRQLKEMDIPDTVVKIGAHAFYNCRALEKITLSDNTEDIGDGAFKNCFGLKYIEIRKYGDSIKCLKGILSEVNNEVIVTIHYPDADACLVFPYYLYNYEENTPARIVNQITEGSGVQYRECLNGTDVDYISYDRLFEEGMHIDVMDASWKIACMRLKYPYKLSENIKENYRQYLKKYSAKLIDEMNEKDNLDGLKLILSMDLTDRDDLRKCIDNARSKSQMEGLGMLLNYEKEKYGTQKRKFEL